MCFILSSKVLSTFCQALCWYPSFMTTKAPSVMLMLLTSFPVPSTAVDPGRANRDVANLVTLIYEALVVLVAWDTI